MATRTMGPSASGSAPSLLDQFYSDRAAAAPALLSPTHEGEEALGWEHMDQPSAASSDASLGPRTFSEPGLLPGYPLQNGGSGMARSQSGRLAPLATTAEEANPLRRRVESCLLQRERTVQGLTTWLNTAYLIQEKVGAAYGSGSGVGASSADLRRWRTVSASTRDDHRIKAALYIAALRQHTMELVEALAEWRASRAPLQIVTGSGRAVDLPRPFVWRGRWWPLQLCLDPPLLPLPLASDPLLLRWFDESADAPLWQPKPTPAAAAAERQRRIVALSVHGDARGGEGEGERRRPRAALALPPRVVAPARRRRAHGGR